MYSVAKIYDFQNTCIIEFKLKLCHISIEVCKNSLTIVDVKVSDIL